MKQLNLEASDALPNQIDQISLCDDDSHIWGEDDAATDEHSSDSLILSREWERRHSRFHTMGYRDGITAGKEASAQEGFNDGFKQSVYAGYSWGLVRGISSVMATFPDHLKEKLIDDPQNKERLQKLYESTQAVSSNNALQIFHSNIQQNGNINSSQIVNAMPRGAEICNSCLAAMLQHTLRKWTSYCQYKEMLPNLRRQLMFAGFAQSFGAHSISFHTLEKYNVSL